MSDEMQWSGALFEGLGAQRKPEEASQGEPVAAETAKAQQTAIVIDANVLIKQLRLRDLMGASDDQDFASRYRVLTVPEVLKEIKDESARAYLESLPFELEVRESEPADFEKVRAFAKETGDLKTLSWVDMKVIALGVTVAREAGEEVRQAPKALTEFKPKRFEDEYKKLEEEEEESDSEEEAPQPRRGRGPKEGEGFDDF